MPRFTAKMFGLRFARDEFGKTMDAAILVLIREAARAWLRAMIVQVPVWTGQARGSIKFAQGPNGNLSRYLNVAIPINPHPNASTAKKNERTGARYGKWNITKGNHVYRFFFRSNLDYFQHNEFFARSDPGAGGQQVVAPWQSFQTGAAAFEAAIRAGKSKLPRIQKAITKYEIS